MIQDQDKWKIGKTKIFLKVKKSLNKNCLLTFRLYLATHSCQLLHKKRVSSSSVEDSRDVVLERMRDRRLNGAALVMQTFMKGRKDRCGSLRARGAKTALVGAQAEVCLSRNT